MAVSGQIALARSWVSVRAADERGDRAEPGPARGAVRGHAWCAVQRSTRRERGRPLGDGLGFRSVSVAWAVRAGGDGQPGVGGPPLRACCFRVVP